MVSLLSVQLVNISTLKNTDYPGVCYGSTVLALSTRRSGRKILITLHFDSRYFYVDY